MFSDEDPNFQRSLSLQRRKINSFLANNRRTTTNTKTKVTWYCLVWINKWKNNTWNTTLHSKYYQYNKNDAEMIY